MTKIILLVFSRRRPY